MNYWCEKGHFNLDQAGLFKELVMKNNPKYVLETGFCTGRSASSILNNAPSLTKMISIDINFDYIKPEGSQYRKILTEQFSNFFTIEGSSHKILNKEFIEKEFPNGIDWFTVDGDHSYNGCLNDLENVYKYMNKGGIIIVDDYKSGPPNGCNIVAVTNACDHFHKKHPEIVKEEWNKSGKGFCIFKI
jgi:predicted O-methyltransferase YrrM